jgi:hypothetical protein
MTEIVVDIVPVGILHIEVLIPLGHRMDLRYMGNHVDTFCYLTGLVYQDKSVIVYLWPFRRNAMQIPSLRKELTTHGIGRDDNLGFLIMLQEVSQAACMVAMSMRNENVVHIAEIYAQQLCVSDKHVTRSSIKQNRVPIRLQKDRQPMLCGQTANSRRAVAYL